MDKLRLISKVCHIKDIVEGDFVWSERDKNNNLFDKLG